MEINKIKGLTAAVVTPMKSNGDIDLAALDRYAEFLISRGVQGVFVNGTTGEGVLMDNEERKALAERWMKYSDRLNILVHVGSTSYKLAADLAAHAESLGVKAISAMAPCFLQPSRAEELLEFHRQIAKAAPNTPYYFYNIPSATGCNVDMMQFMEGAAKTIDNFAGLKYTDFNTAVQLDCIRFDGGRFDILHGHDETLLNGLQLGSTGGIGTSYNVTSPIFVKLLEAWNAGKFELATDYQYEANKYVTLMCKHVNCILGVKAMLDIMGVPCGPCRAPLRNYTAQEFKALEKDFLALGTL